MPTNAIGFLSDEGSISSSSLARINASLCPLQIPDFILLKENDIENPDAAPIDLRRHEVDISYKRD
jgi:hypothetical protein